MAEWQGVVHATTEKFLPGCVEQTIRDRVVLAMLEKRGKITYNHSGDGFNWRFQAIEEESNQYSDGETITFAGNDKFRKATLDWRRYIAASKMTDYQKELNKGNEAIIKLSGRIMKDLMKSMRDKFGGELYVDGHASGNDSRLCGIESFMGLGTTAAGDIVGQPSDTYAGVSTAVGQYESTWSALKTTKPNATIATDWPDPQGRHGYQCWSPKIFNTSSTSWGTGSTAWEDNGPRVIRKAHHVTRMGNGKEGDVDAVVLASDWFTDYCNKQEAKQRVQIPVPELAEFGFQSIQQEGIAITKDYDCPASTGYGWNFDQMELMSLKSDLFDSVPPEFSIKDNAYLYLMRMYGNLKFESPQAFFKLKAVA